MFMNSETQHSKDANSPQMIWGLTPFFVSRFNTVQFSSVAQLCPTLCDPMNRSTLSITQASLSITNSRSSPKLMSIELVMSSSHRILCRPLLLLPFPPSIRVFSNESTLRMRFNTVLIKISLRFFGKFRQYYSKIYLGGWLRRRPRRFHWSTGWRGLGGRRWWSSARSTACTAWLRTRQLRSALPGTPRKWWSIK